MIDAAIAIGSAVLPSLINLIREGLDSGLSEEEATRRALERMAATELPKPLTQETKDAFAAARERLEAERAKTQEQRVYDLRISLSPSDRKKLGELARSPETPPTYRPLLLQLSAPLAIPTGEPE